MDTKKKIKETLLRLLKEHSANKLTVKMVCMEAGISKQTLYNHYYGVIDALEDAYNSEFIRTMENCSTYDKWVEGFRKFLEFLLEARDIMLHTYNSSYRTDLLNLMGKGCETLIKKGIADVSDELGVRVSEKDRGFMLKAYKYFFLGIIEDYLIGGMQESPEYLASRCEAMLGSNIRNTIINLEKKEKGDMYDRKKEN